MSTISRKEKETRMEAVNTICNRIIISITDILAETSFDDSRDLQLVLSKIAEEKLDMLEEIANTPQEEEG